MSQGFTRVDMVAGSTQTIQFNRNGFFDSDKSLRWDDNRLINMKGYAGNLTTTTLTSYQVLSTQQTIIANPGTDAIFTLPDATTASNNIITVKNKSSYYIEVEPSGANTIEDATGSIGITSLESKCFHSDGLNWQIINEKKKNRFGYFYLSADQTTNTSNGNHVQFNGAVGSFNLSTGSAQQNGQITLLKNRLYLLQASGIWGFSAAGYVGVSWYDTTTPQYLGKQSICYSQTWATNNNAGNPIAISLFSPTYDSVVELRFIQQSNFTYVESDYTAAYILEV